MVLYLEEQYIEGQVLSMVNNSAFAEPFQSRFLRFENKISTIYIVFYCVFASFILAVMHRDPLYLFNKTQKTCYFGT